MKGMERDNQPELKIQPGNAVRAYQPQQYSALKVSSSLVFTMSFTDRLIYNKAV
jgi:hypothetical protein